MAERAGYGRSGVLEVYVIKQVPYQLALKCYLCEGFHQAFVGANGIRPGQLTKAFQAIQYHLV